MDLSQNQGPCKHTTALFWGETAPNDHILQVYVSDDDLIEGLDGYVNSGFRGGESVIVIATPEHLSALNERLRQQQWDLFSLVLQDRYIPLSAEEALGHFMINGQPDKNLFYHMLSNLLLRARKQGRGVRAFGEMVALLWSKGHALATVRLEQLWTQFCDAEQFKLFCAYPQSGFTEDAHGSLTEIVHCHSKTVSSNDKGDQELISPERTYRKTAS